MSLTILMTNNSLDYRSGTELYIRDVALGLQERGHRVAAYSTRLGDVAEDLRQAGVTVKDDLQGLGLAPDLIHGQHHLETMSAVASFPSAPAVYFCHGTVPWQESPPDFPRIYRYAAVDQRTAQLVLDKTSANKDRVHLIPNFVDLTRFRPRPPLPGRPRKAAVFSSTLQRDKIPLIREACRRLGLELDLLGKVSGRFCHHPEKVLGQYDLILAKGKAALESLAVGSCVLLCDYAALGPLVTSGNLDGLRRFNLGLACLDRPLTVEGLTAEMCRYDASDAARVSARIRSEAGFETALERILRLYRSALEDHREARLDHAAELQAVGQYIKAWTSDLHELERRSSRLREELDRLNNTFTIRLRNQILHAPLLGSAIRWLIRRQKEAGGKSPKGHPLRRRDRPPALFAGSRHSPGGEDY